ncbi:uncharacterized protein LOC111080293 [Drosophila obscura]|uniref:uncharacterized protein LOC111080293 n=1 Tax=Drosophila obscura TaxID=7282 RepID=UPI001BB13B36|nr:uncharacterized protein LOC111080293 [Drosophila obscura]
MWAMNLYSVLCVSCLLFVMIHRRHGDIQAAPIHSTHGSGGSTESSLQESNSAIQGPKIDEAIMDPGQTQELVSVSESNMALPTGLSRKFTSKIVKNSPTVDNDSVSEKQKAGVKQRQGRAIKIVLLVSGRG